MPSSLVNLRSSLLRSLLVYGAADLSNVALALAAAPVLTRLLTQSQYGATPLLLAAWGTVALIRHAGMDSAYPFFRATGQHDDRRLVVSATFVATGGTILASLAFSAAALASGWLSSYAGVSRAELVAFLAGLIPTNLLLWYALLLRFAQEPVRYARTVILAQALGVVTALALMPALRPSDRLFAYLALGSAGNLAGALWALRETVKSRQRPYDWNSLDSLLAKRMLKFGMLLVPAAVVYGFSDAAGRLVLGAVRDPAAVAVFALGTSLAGVIGLFRRIFIRAWEPMLVDWLASGDSETYTARLQTVATTIALLLLPATLVALAWSTPIVRFLFPSVYAPAARLVPPLALAVGISMLSLVAVATTYIAHTTRFHLPVYGAGLVVRVVVAVIVVRALDVLGVAVSTLIAELFILSAWIFVGRAVTRNLAIRWLVPFSSASAASFAAILVDGSELSLSYRVALTAAAASIALATARSTMRYLSRNAVT